MAMISLENDTKWYLNCLLLCYYNLKPIGIEKKTLSDILKQNYGK